jgi:branched-chain amino acid transport system substrate-binding protein
MIVLRKFVLAALSLFAALAFSYGSAFAADPIVIGVPTSLGTIEGKESLNAVTLAVEEINKAGGVKVGGQMRPFKVTSADIRDAAAGVPVPEALLGIEKMILEEKPSAIVVGPFRSEALMAAMDIFAKYKMPMLGTIAMTPASAGKFKSDPAKYKYIFRMSSNAIYFSQLLGGGMQQMRTSFGYTKVYIMHQDVLWARGTAGALVKNYFEKTGWQVLGQDAFPTGATDFSSSLRKASLSGAQVILVIFDMPESGILIKQWKSQRVPAVVAGFISPMAGSGAWDAFDHNIGGLMNAIVEVGNMPSDKYAPSARFYHAYQARFGEPIQSGHGPAPAYDSVYMLKDAIERANSTDPDAVVAALQQTKRQGVVGELRVNDVNQVVYGKDPSQEGVGLFFQWGEDGKRRVIYPPALAEGEIELPPWLKK